MLPNVTGNHNFIDIYYSWYCLLSYVWEKFGGRIWNKYFMLNKAALIWSKYCNIVKYY